MGPRLLFYEIVIFLHASHHRKLAVDIYCHNGIGEIVWNLATSEP